MNAKIDISLPDRYDMLQRKAVNQLEQIISPVDESLSHIDMMHAEMRASSRGAFLILRGDSGSGKSTFIHTVKLFRSGVEILTFAKNDDVSECLGRIQSTTHDLRIIILEGREALTDVSNELLEKSIHAINSFVRTLSGEKTLIAWPVNRDDLADNLAKLAVELGAESLIGLGEPIYRFAGPQKTEYLTIANKTIALLNQGENIHDLGISTIRAEQLLQESKTIGEYLARIRADLLLNQRNIAALVKKEVCRVWVVVIAGNDPDNDIDGLTRGTMYSADIDRMLSVTNANIVRDLKAYPEKIGLLGTYFDARVLHVPVLAALAVARSHATEDLRRTMKAAGMSVAPEDDVMERFKETNLAYSFLGLPIGARKVGGKAGTNSVAAFHKMTAIAATNDVALNRALAECLVKAGLIESYSVEQNFGGGLKRRTDIVAKTKDSVVRLEVMWRKKTGRAEISNYVLTKLFNYGKAIGYLS